MSISVEELTDQLVWIQNRLGEGVYDCCCEDNDECQKCQSCVILRAIADVQNLIEPDHMPTIRSQRRLKSQVRERILHDMWIEKNKRTPGINGGGTAIEHILDDRSSIPPHDYHGPPRVTFRDAQVAATVIQWLGTNVGNAFLCEYIKLRDQKS